MASRTRYVLSSEINLIKRKHPSFEIQLPEVLYSDEELQERRDAWAADHDGKMTGYKEPTQPRLPSETILVKSGALMSDEVINLSRVDPVAAAREHVGAEQYSTFVAHGGSSNVLMAIIQRDQEASPGESKPSDAS